METVEKWVSLREFARNREVRLSAVQKAIESGRVTAFKRNGKGRLVAIELYAATAQWNGNTDVDQAARAGAPLFAQVNTLASAGGGKAVDLPQGNAAVEVAGTGSDATVAPSSSGADGKDPHGYLEARADKERAQAKRAELDYLERVGELVSVTAVREQEFAVFRKLRDNLTAIGDRLAPRLAAETDPVRAQHLISEEIRKALHELSRALAIDDARGAGERPSTLQ